MLRARLAASANIANIAKNVNTANCARLRTVRDILGANTANTAIIVQNAGCAKSFVDQDKFNMKEKIPQSNESDHDLVTNETNYLGRKPNYRIPIVFFPTQGWKTSSRAVGRFRNLDD